MERVSRRALLGLAATGAAVPVAGCSGPGDPDATATDDAVPVDAGWPTFARDARNTGQTDAPAPGPAATTAWRTGASPPATGPSRRFAAPLLGGSTGFVVGRDGRLRAVTLADGSVRWELGDLGPVTPALASGRLYYRALVGERSPVRAVDVATGERAWERDLDRIVERGGMTVGSDALYVTGGPGPATALSRAGDVRWRAEGPASIGAPALADGALFVTTREGLHAYDAATGDRRWAERVRSRDAPSVADDRVFVGTDRGVRALRTDGSPAWTARLPDPVRGTPAVAGETVLAATTGGTVVALAATDGTERWRTTLRAAVTAPVAVAGDLVLVGTRGEDVMALSLESGDERWRAWLRAPVAAPPAVADGRALVRDGDGRTTLLAGRDTPSFPDVGSWPAALGDAGNTGRAPGASLPAEPAVGWRVGVEVDRSRALVAGGRVLAADDDGVYAFSAASGHLDWRHAALDPDVATSVCSVAGERVLAGVGGVLHAFDLAPGAGAGRSRWRATLPNGSIVTAGTVADGTAYVTAYDAGELAAIDVATGEVGWTMARTTGFSHPPAVAGDHAYVGATQGDLYAVDRETGSVTAEASLSDVWSLTPHAVRDGRAVAASKKGTVFGYDVPACEAAWRTSVGDGSRTRFLAAPAVANGRVYLPDVRGAVHAFDADSGDRIASTDLPAGVRTPPRVVDGHLLVGTWKDPGGARLFALSLDDLQVRWSVTVFDSGGVASIGSIAPVRDRVYVAGTGVAMVR